MSSLSSLYPALVIQHDREPHNAGPVEGATHRAQSHNPLCGDRVTVTLRVEGDRVLALGCEARGCALCRASGSLMTLVLQGLEDAAALGLCREWLETLGCRGVASVSDPALEPLAPLLAVVDFPSRIGCVCLPWEGFRLALEGAETAAV